MLSQECGPSTEWTSRRAYSLGLAEMLERKTLSVLVWLPSLLVLAGNPQIGSANGGVEMDLEAYPGASVVVSPCSPVTPHLIKSPLVRQGI
jgi:hypothetical protein